jgi:hypothetical protein
MHAYFCCPAFSSLHKRRVQSPNRQVAGFLGNEFPNCPSEILKAWLFLVAKILFLAVETV